MKSEMVLGTASKSAKSLTNWAGVDEAGRGPLAGPVVAAAVLLPQAFDTSGVTDSKAMTPHQREAAFERIVAGAAWSVGVAEVDEIDEVNILQATMNAMRRALIGLSVRFDGALIDGNRAPSNLDSPIQLCIGGDRTYAQISAASIIAKVFRDRLMARRCGAYPAYGFSRNFGYATPEHLAALKAHGACALHRRTFAPVREVLEQPCLDFAS